MFKYDLHLMELISTSQPELDKWLSFAAEKEFKCSDANSLHVGPISSN